MLTELQSRELALFVGGRGIGDEGVFLLGVGKEFVCKSDADLCLVGLRGGGRCLDVEFEEVVLGFDLRGGYCVRVCY